MRRWIPQALLALVAPLLAGAAGAADVYLALDAAGNGRYTIEARFWTPGDPSGAWQVLTDYDHLPSFIPSLRRSEIQERTDSGVILKQEAVGRALGIFHRHLDVILKVREISEREIHFEDTAHEDFSSYGGFWKIEPAAGSGSWVRYRLQATPKFFAPAVVARKAFRDSARQLLLSVQNEILRRGDLSETLLCCSGS